MRRILAIIALFSTMGLSAQPPAPSEGCERPRSRLLIYPTAEAATAAGGGDNRYLTHIGQWDRDANRLTAPFTMPFAWVNRQVLFRVGSASGPYEVFVNGERVGYNADGNLPAEFNLTRKVHEGRNTLELRFDDPQVTAPLESWKEPDGPLSIGETWVMSPPTMYIRDVLVTTQLTEGSNKATAEIAVAVKSGALNPRTSRIQLELLGPSGDTALSEERELTLDMRREDTVRFKARIPVHLLWSAELPTLYTLRLKTRHEGRIVECMEFPVGFRHFATEGGEPLVNGERVTLRSYEIAPQILTENLLARLQELGFNTLLFKPGAVPATLLDMCDIMGMYIIAQSPIDTSGSGESRRKEGNPSNDPAWQESFLERTAASYHTTKLHPSVIAFSLARQSANGINLYESYLALKRYGDSRPIIYRDAEGEWNSDPLTLN